MEAIVRKTVITVGYVLVCCCNNKILDGSEARLRESRARSYLKDADESAEVVQKMSGSIKFNNEQCNYLGEKLCVVIQSARSFLEMSGKEEVGTTSKKDHSDFVKILELLMVLGKQIESFVEGCCKDNWIQAAMVLSNMSEYVSSLGFNLELCNVAFGKERKASGCLTLDEVDGMKKSEAEHVQQKASVDAKLLTEKVTLTLTLGSLNGDDRDLANYLLQSLSQSKRVPSSGSGTFLSNLFEWVKPKELLGRGSSASVYTATWLGTWVAKKTFPGSKNDDFEKEVEILSRLCHPNITSMFCCTRNKRNCSIIMELMDGDLNQLIEERLHNSGDSPPFPIMEAVDIMLQIGEGVNYLHKKGIVHRDLKSGNILYKSMNGKNVAIGYVDVKVADFGISKARDTNITYKDLTRNTGTNRWMPPEVIGLSDKIQRERRKYPFKLDSYSFGLVCYEILVGQVPFSNYPDPKELKRRILEKERPSLPSDCPPMLKALIEKCWSHEPEERPAFGEICSTLAFIKYSLMTGGLMNMDESQIGETIAEGKSAMSESGQFNSRGHSQPGSHCLPSNATLVAPQDGGKVTEVFYGPREPTNFVDTEPYYQTRPAMVPPPAYVHARDVDPVYRTRAPVAPSSTQTHVVPVGGPVVNNVKLHPQGLVLSVPMCCEKCEEKVREALEDLEGARDVILDKSNQLVTIHGDVNPERALRRVRRVNKRSKFWKMATQPLQYSGSPATGRVHSKSLINEYRAPVDRTSAYRAPGYYTSAYRAPSHAEYLTPPRYTSSYSHAYSSPYIDSAYRSGYVESRGVYPYGRLAFDDLEYRSRFDRGTPYLQMIDYL